MLLAKSRNSNAATQSTKAYGIQTSGRENSTVFSDNKALIRMYEMDHSATIGTKDCFSC